MFKNKLLFSNKHIVTAMIVAPLLAIMSYFATDYIVSDLPEAAESGKTYSLLARSNCRYESGKCDLENGDMEVRLELLDLANGQSVLQAQSSTPLKGARIALLNDKNEPTPMAFIQTDDKGLTWRIDVNESDLNSREIRIAMATQANTFYGSTQTDFFRYSTSFNRENW